MSNEPTVPIKPTVLHVLNASDAGGLTSYVLNVGRALLENGWRVIVATDRGAWHDRLIAGGFEVLELPITRGFSGFRQSVKMLRERLKGQRIDLIHSHYRKSTHLARRFQKSRAVNERPPILYTLHLSHINVKGWRRWMTDFGDHVHIASEDAREWMTKDARVPPERITCVPHGIDPSLWPITTADDRARARRELNLHPDATVMLFVGRLDYPKNEMWVIDAHQAARRTIPNLQTLIVGDGPNRTQLESIVKYLNRVHLLGERNPLSAYRAADLFVLPSEREGFSYVCCEAMSSGLAILRTRTSGTSETVIENVTGKSVPIDHDIFEKTAVEMLRDPKRLAEMGRNAARHVRDHLTFDRQIHRTLDLYRSLAKLG
ncbi:MAG TPA: glycosyltransferase family 4 protein [Tepidisphaeraceae bacterium]|nr:glycosyltransferase family 4 protein [Tepidisphaeraceae bacterium]